MAKEMKILHYSLGKVNPDNANGVNRVISGLAKYCNRIDDVEVEVLTWRKKQREPYKKYKRDGFFVEGYRRLSDVLKTLSTKLDSCDLVHLHNVWNISNDLIARILIKRSKPYFITVHSGLAQDRVKDSRYALKKLYQSFVQRQTLDRAAGIQALASEEFEDIRLYTTNENVFILPNGVDLEVMGEYSRPKNREKIIIGYIGRFGKEKNIHALIEALDYLNQELLERLEIWMAGPIDSDAQRLITVVESRGMGGTIKFIGPKYGSEKRKFFKTIDAVVHPALSEGGSISVLEAMCAGLPMVITRTSSVSTLHKHDFFEMVDAMPRGIAGGIERVIERRNEWADMGYRGRKVIENELNWGIIGRRMVRRYLKAVQDNMR